MKLLFICCCCGGGDRELSQCVARARGFLVASVTRRARQNGNGLLQTSNCYSGDTDDRGG